MNVLAVEVIIKKYSLYQIKYDINIKLNKKKYIIIFTYNIN